MNLQHVKETIKLKMQAEAPQLYARLEAAGSLEAYLDELTEDVKADVVNATVKAGADPKLQSAQKHMERVQAMESEGRATLNALLAELEFPEDTPTTTDSATTT